jgi:hypothetical protein
MLPNNVLAKNDSKKERRRQQKLSFTEDYLGCHGGNKTRKLLS